MQREKSSLTAKCNSKRHDFESGSLTQDHCIEQGSELDTLNWLTLEALEIYTTNESEGEIEEKASFY